MAAPRIDLEKFNGKNDFNMWKVKMEALLIIQGLGDAIELATKKEGKEGSSSRTPEQIAEIDKKAKSTIILSLSDLVIREVSKEKTMAELWAKLESLYMTKSLANKLYIKKRMFSLKMAEGSSLDEHIDEFNKVCDTLETIDEGLNDEGKALLLISSLPPSYSNFVNALMYGRQHLSLDEVKAALNTRGLQEKQVNRVHGDGLTVKEKIDKTDGKKKKQGKTKIKNKNLKSIVEEKGYESTNVCVATEEVQKGKWILDSGCTFHMSHCQNFFSEYHKIDGGKVMMGNNAVCKVIGIRNVCLKLHNGTIREVKQVRHVPDLKRNLISLGMLDQVCYSARLEHGKIEIHNGATLVIKGSRKNGVYVLDGEVVTGESSVSTKVNMDATRLWHLRLGHMSIKGLKELAKQGVLGSDKIEELVFCEDCVLGKSTRASFKRSQHKTMDILEYIHSNLWGPSQVPSMGGNRFFMSIIDDFSRRVWVYVLRTKDQVFGKFKDWKALVENQIGKKVKKLRIDNGLEYCNKMFDDFCASEGIGRHRTVRMTPQQNGLAERMNMTLMNKVRCMMIQSKLPKGLWAETLLTACLLVNLSPSAAIEFKTPYELWSGKPGNYNNLKVFGCTTYAHTNQGKLEPRALKGQLIGYPDGVKGYKLWCSQLTPPRCITSRDIVFNEETELSSSNPAKATESQDRDSDEDNSENEDHNTEHQHQQNQTELEDYQLAKDRKRRTIRPPKRYGYADLISYALATSHEIDETELKSYKEAVNSTSNVEWQEAMDDEISFLYRNNTWELVRKPNNRRLVGCKWIYRIKDGVSTTEPRRFKARLVAKGYTQNEGIDFKEVFSHVVRHASIRVLLALTAVYDMELDQLDVKTTFLHGNLQEEIFMTQPEGYTDQIKPNHVCLPKKSLYGLKQSPRQWYLRFDEFITSHGFNKCSFDCCVYYKTTKADLRIYLLLYVDDMLIACKQRDEIDALKLLLSLEFDMKDLGHAKKILGLEIRRNRKEGKIFLTQEKYLAKVLDTFGMQSCKPVMTPLASHLRLSNQQCPHTNEEKSEMLKIPYANAVGCMMYAMGTLGLGLQYGRSEGRNSGLCGYVESDFAGDNDRRRPLTGYMFMLNGCLINWKASLQHIVALSTTEAEYTAATEDVKEALWLKGMLAELGKKQQSVDIHCDSSSAIYLSKNRVHHKRTKHIDVKLHFIRNEVSKGVIKMVKVHTDSNPADMLTKVVPTAKFNLCLDLIGVCSS
ncbi:hypothetical protein KPL70_026198 [Citrus sinensis]|nr:hypothetical protein KPL70_026198 [Citrus sinensis]